MIILSFLYICHNIIFSTSLCLPRTSFDTPYNYTLLRSSVYCLDNWALGYKGLTNSEILEIIVSKQQVGIKYISGNPELLKLLQQHLDIRN